MAHDSAPKISPRVATITVSDTRTPDDDEGGKILSALLRDAGFPVTGYVIVPDDVEAIRGALFRVCDEDLADAVITTGGTGIAPRDVTYEAIEPLLEKRLDGFGEAFRRLSWEEVGPRAMLSRALAGTLRGRIVVVLPGSPGALRLAVPQIIAPILAHAVGVARGQSAASHSSKRG
jgi:molybdenum cofactor biosynthesis protein B